MKRYSTSIIVALVFCLTSVSHLFAQTWYPPVLVESLTGRGGIIDGTTSMQQINGRPAIAYCDESHANLFYCRAVDAIGSSWQAPVPVDYNGSLGGYCDLLDVNGKPAIAYYDATNLNLKYVRALDMSGNVWGNPVVVDSIGSVGAWPSLRMINGYPAISYYDATSGNLKYVISQDIYGTVWNTAITVDAAVADVGKYSSLENVSGNPAIAYYDETNDDLKYVRATNPSGSTWGAPLVLVSSQTVGRYPVLRVANSNPVVCYLDEWNSNLCYKRATNSTGTAWAVSIVLESAVSDPMAMEIVNGNPAISFFSFTNSDLKYKRATNASGTAWAASIFVDQTGTVGRESCMAIVNGNPAILYADNTNGNAKYMRANDIDGIAWTYYAAFDATAEMGVFPSACLIQGRPAMTYRDELKGDVRFVLANDSSGSTWGTPIIVDSIGNAGWYSTIRVVKGFPTIAYLNNAGTGVLKYVRALDSLGTSWGTPVSVAPSSSQFSFEIVDGMPALAYRASGMRYKRALDSTGTTWPGAPVTVDAATGSGEYPSMTVVNGNPAIAYEDGTNIVKYVRANNVTGSTWPTPISVTASSNGTPCLKVVNGRPAIAYYSYTTFDLFYVRSNDVNGASWATSVTVDAAGVAGQYPQMQIINGNPAISYVTSVGGSNILYVRSNDASGSAWPLPDSVTADNFGGQRTALLVMGNGSPGIGFYNGTERFPYFLGESMCNNPTIPVISSSNLNLCEGDSTVLTATGSLNAGTDWYWYSGSCGGQLVGTGPTITVSPAASTMYYCRGQGGCAFLGPCGSIAVVINTVDTLVTVNNPTLTAHLSGASYQWINCANSTPVAGATNQSFTPVANGSYAVIVTSSGCSDTSSCHFVAASLAVTTTHTNPVCNSQCTGTATASPAGGTAPYSYLWSPGGQTTSGVTGLCAGTYTVTVTDAMSTTTTSTVTITQPTLLTLNASNVINATCFGSCNGSLTLTASGGTTGYTYSPSSNNLCAGTYTFTVTDANGCSATHTQTITAPLVLAATCSSTASCGNNNGTATVVATGGTGGYSYSWSPSGGNSATASNLASGNYTCTISDANGCTTSATVNVVSNSVPTTSLQSSGSVSCFGGNDGTGTISASGNGPFAYMWSPIGGNAATAVNLTAQVYTVTVTDNNGCSSTQTVSITQPTAVTASITAFTDAMCGNNDGTATALGSGGTGGFTYAWSPSGGNSATAINLGAGGYTVTVTDANGCVGTTTVLISNVGAPTVTMQNNIPVTCFGQSNGSAAITASGNGPFTYSWAPTGGNAATATNLAAGTYTVSVTDNGGCTAFQTVVITEPNLLTAPVVGVNGTCGNSNGSANVTPTGGTGPYTYLWSNSQTTQQITGLGAGNFSVTVTDVNGCSVTQTVTITQSSAVTATATATPGTICNGSCIALNIGVISGGTSPYVYNWQPGNLTGSSVSVCPTATTCYTLLVTDAVGCTSTASVCVNVNALPTVTYNETQTTACVNWNPITLSPGSPAGGTYSGVAVSGNTFAPATAGTGTFTITYTYSDVNGCADSATSQIIVDLCTGTYQLADTEELEVSTFPNPFDETITVQCDNLEGAATIEFFNVLGEVVYSSVIVSPKTEINLQGLPSGTYFIRINSASASNMHKIVKQ